MQSLDSYFSKSVELDTFDKFVNLMYLRREQGGDIGKYVADFRTRFDAVVSTKVDLQSVCSMLLMANGSFTAQEQALLKSILLRDGGISDLKVAKTCETVKTLLVDSASTQSPSGVKLEAEASANAVHFRKGNRKGGKGKGKWNSHTTHSNPGKGWHNDNYGKSWNSHVSGHHGKGYNKGYGKGKRQYNSYGHSGDSQASASGYGKSTGTDH